MLISTENEIITLMPTARWSRPEQLFGYLEEEERVALEPLLGTALYQHLCNEYDRLTDIYEDITATTIKPTNKAKEDARVAYANVTDRLDDIRAGILRRDWPVMPDDYQPVPDGDMQAIRLIRICQQIEFYKMLSHKTGMLTVSFNEGGGMNTVSSDGYDDADEKAKDRVVKDAYMSAGRAIDSLLLFLEADAKGDRLFTEKWSEADAFYLHKDLLFQTARVLNEYLDIKGERMAYVQLVRDIRFCQNTYLKPRIGGRLLQAVVEWANTGAQSEGQVPDADESDQATCPSDCFDELLSLLRTALAFYVEARRISISHINPFSGSSSSLRNSSSTAMKEETLARRDSMTDAQQAMAMACQYVEDNLDALGDAAVGTPIYNAVREREAKEMLDRECACAALARRRRETCEQTGKKLFTGFPATHRTPERQ